MYLSVYCNFYDWPKRLQHFFSKPLQIGEINDFRDMFEVVLISEKNVWKDNSPRTKFYYKVFPNCQTEYKTDLLL